MERHPTRQELIAAAKETKQSITSHIARCEDCRALFELFHAFPIAGEIPLADAPGGWINKAKEIADAVNPVDLVRNLVARLSFDSWSMAAAVGVRSQTAEQDRRMRFELGTAHLDLRVEQTDSGWEFTGQLGSEGEFSSEAIVLADRQEICPNRLGFYQWSSARPPKRIAVRAGELLYTLPELTWKRKPQK